MPCTTTPVISSTQVPGQDRAVHSSSVVSCLLTTGPNLLSPRLNILPGAPAFMQVVLAGIQLPFFAFSEPLLLQQVLKTQISPNFSQSLLTSQSLVHLSAA
jgi:hypothetical protein